EHRLRRGAGHVDADEGDVAPVLAVDAGDDIEQRGLARAVRPDEPDDLSLLDVEIDGIERDEAAEAAGQFAAGEQGGHKAFLSPPRESRNWRGSSPCGRNSKIRITRTA